VRETKKRLPDDWQSTLNQLGKTVEEKGKNAVIQFPLWPEAKRGTPNSFLRSALFSAIQSKDRRWLEDEVLYSQKGITIKFRGQQLNQEDLTLWETLVHLARQHPLGNECFFTAHHILKALGSKSQGGENHKRLHSGIMRLAGGLVQVTHEDKTYFGPLIDGGLKDEVTNHYKIWLNRNLIRLYGDTQWTAIDWDQRQALKRKPLAQALHAYYSSHREPYPVKIETLRQLTGSRNKQTASFKRQIKTAYDALKNTGFLDDYKIDGNVVKVQRTPVLSYE